MPTATFTPSSVAGLPPVRSAADRRHGEPIFFLRSAPGAPAEGHLLFPPRRILRAYRADRQVSFRVEDFRVTQRRLTYVGAEPLPCLTADELFPATETPFAIGHHRDGVRYLLFGQGGPLFHEHQVCFDYETDARWAAPVAATHASLLPRLHHRIANREPIAVALLGDSISAGGDASGFLNVAPQQPAYGALFAQQLSQRAQAPVEFHNLSVGGMNSAWGVEQAAAVAALQPHLVVVAFGMNDASGRLSPDEFAANIAAIVHAVEGRAPAAEFVLVAGMDANPAWSFASLDLKPAYCDRLAALARAHVAYCEIKTSWDYLLARKDYPSLTGNGVNHPNDFGHRLYAELLADSALGAPSASAP